MAFITVLKAKIHRATITYSDLHYEGSITVDPLLLEAAGILPYEQVDVLDVNSGSRFTTYAIEGERGAGEIGVNGAAARLVQKGDIVIICAYQLLHARRAEGYRPVVVQVDAKNNPK
ncbi:MAG: aspartate 1-decarboxylase [Rickettsiales bacterium]